MPEHAYDRHYFDRYTTRGRFTGRLFGRRGVPFWVAHFRRVLGDGARMLEVGCGLGHFGAEASRYFDYEGIDVSEEAVGWGREHLGLTTLSVGDAQALPAPDASLDAVVALDVTEHLPDPPAFFREAARVLRPGGLLHIRTPNTRSLGVRLKDGHPVLTPSMHHDPTHCALLPPEEWLRLIGEAGLVPTRHGTDGLWDLPYTTRVPLLLQKLVVLPFNAVLDRTVGVLPWSLGENLTVEARKPSA